MGEAGGGKMPRPQRSNPHTRHNAIELRKQPTPAEIKLWSRIRHNQLGVKFRRQHAIGNYIPDFSQRDAVRCSPEARLVIELDGSQHVEQEGYDNERTKYLASRGYRVIRFWNNDVLNNLEAVILAILNALEKQQ